MTNASPPGPEVPSAPLTEPVPRDLEHTRGGWKELLQNRRFLLLTASGSLAGAGYAVYSISVLFLAYGLTGNLLVAGAVLFIEYGVYTATFLVAPLVDRARDKRTILLICYPIQAVAAAALALELKRGSLSVPVLLGLVLVLAVGWDFVWAVFNIAPPIVLPKRQLFVADALGGVVSTGTQIGGYTGGGALLYFIGPYGGATAYVFLLVGAALVTVPLSLTIANPPQTRFWETFLRGWDTFRGKGGRALRSFVTVETYLGFFAAVPPLLITAVAYQNFATPAEVYGPLVTAYALGGSITGIIVGHLNPRRRVGLILVICPALAGLTILALVPQSTSALVVGGLFAGVGAAFSVRYNAKYTWVQGTYPHEVLGRLTANLYLFTGIAGTIAVLLVGTLSERISLANLEVIDGVGLLGGGILCLANPFIRKMAF